MRPLAEENRFHRLILKLVALAGIYGFVFVNWIDLFNVTVPGYHIWLIFMFFFPFVSQVFMFGRKDIELVVSLGLLASLMNDLFYFVVGDLFFGFHVGLFDWYLHQLGFYGSTVLYTFIGIGFTFPVTSWMMGLAIYGRIIVVSLILNHYWKRKERQLNTNP